MGTLYVVATPIGNLQDVTLRALEVLGEVSLVLCEDTRRTRRLLERHGIEARTRSLHKFNERQRAGEVLKLLDDGRSLALVSDAGTPCISDPGAALAREVAAAGHTLVPIPGASAPTALLSVAGLPASRHLFLGFLPHRAGERARLLTAMADREELLIFLEAPTRIAASLAAAAEILGGSRQAAVGRELTKLYEEVRRGPLEELAAWAAEEKLKGEFTVAVEGSSTPPSTLPAGSIAEQVRFARETLGLDRKDSMRRVARERGISRSEVYKALLEEE